LGKRIHSNFMDAAAAVQTRMQATTTMSETITLVTGNPNKARALTEHTQHFDVQVVAQALPLVEPQADSVEEVAMSKARQAYALLGHAVIVEDSGFSIDGLGGFPGAYTKYVLETIGVRGLLALAETLEARTCRFKSALVYVDERGEAHRFVDDGGAGSLAASIDTTPCPDAWSDLWRIFVPGGASQPLTAMSQAERDRLLLEWQQNSVYTRFGQWFRQQHGGER
jgi:inosine triphosphate pyrophosphatase/XTP/dITP diphosphohydrolase